MRSTYPTAGDLRAALQAAGLTVSSDLEGQLWSMAPAGVQAFERKVRRRMLAGAPQAVSFDPTTDREGLLFIDDLASTDEAGAPIFPTIVYAPQNSTPATWALNTNYRLEPGNAVVRGRPYDRVRLFSQIWMSPLASSLSNSISITGRWGYGALLPDDAWMACLFLGLQSAFETSVYGTRGGLVRWTQQGVTEEYGMGLAKQWQTVIDAAVATYRRLDIG